MDEKDLECVKDLRTTDPWDDKKRIEETKGGLLKDSYLWILDNADFRRWRDEAGRLLWVKGDPGKGKTMLLSGIIDELHHTTGQSDPNITLSFFFCQATDTRINHATGVLRGLLYLLVKQQPALVSHVRDKYEHAGKSLFEDANAWAALSDILTNILQDSTLGLAYLIIDALDECTGDLPRLLDLIVRTSASPRVKWIVSSRNRPQIEEQLRTTGYSCSLELNAESVSAAVNVYIRHKVLHLAQRKRYDAETKGAIQQYLSSNARGTFLWVALVCERLEKASRHGALTRLTEFPPGLDAIYDRMMAQICESDDAEFCKQILALMVIAYRPLSIEESASLVELQGFASGDLESLRELVDLCGSFLTRRDDTVYFVHQSAKDFLLKKASDTVFTSGTEVAHHMVFLNSLKVLGRTLQRDIYGLRRPGFPIDQVVQPTPDKLALARYSSVFWVDHLVAAGKRANKDTEDGGSVHSFLSKKYLNWLEALSLARALPEGALAIDKLQSQIQVCLRRSPSSVAATLSSA